MNPLAEHYRRFRVTERVLLTGHSHQAWPDVAFDGQQRAWLDAAEFVDDKWPVAFQQAARVQAHWKRLLNDDAGDIALGQNTHELIIRLLSALPLRARPKLVTTDGEFHTIRRQLDRLAEEGFCEVSKVPARPADGLAERLTAVIDDRTACVLVSSVLYETAEIVPGLDRVAAKCSRHGAALLIDAYHHLNVIPFDVRALASDQVFITGAGYKYCQLGEGNAFLRIPFGCRMRPVITGWFAEFAGLESGGTRRPVEYVDGAAAFGGATYDPTPHYRASAVFDFHVAQGLTPQKLRDINRHQVALLKERFDTLDADPLVAHVEPIEEGLRGGFLAIRSPRAADFRKELRRREVYTDARGEILRLGPAPYLSDEQLLEGIDALSEILRAFA